MVDKGTYKVQDAMAGGFTNNVNNAITLWRAGKS